MSDAQNQPDPVPTEPIATAPQPDSVDTAPADAAERIAALEAEIAAMKDKWLRSEAETQNLRARAKRELDDARLYAVQKFAADVVEAADTLRRGLDNIPANTAGETEIIGKLREGFEGVERQFLSILNRNGIEREDPLGQAFNAERHHAMVQQPSAEHPPGTVIQAWSPTWMLNGRLLKPAMVVVSAAQPEAQPSAGTPPPTDTPPSAGA